MYSYVICSIWYFSRVSESYQTRRYSTGGAENRRFCVFLTLEFEFHTTYEVSRPLHRREPFIMTFYVYPMSQGTISTSTESSNLLPNINSVFFAVNIELLHTKTRSHIVCSSPNIYAHLITVINVARMCTCVEKAFAPMII